jgi:DNA-binding winged helix-turn-helix (wHTH) protein
MTEPASDVRSELPPIRIWRFRGVELRTDEYSLVVDGRPRPCSRKAFELIRALCRQPRRALPRDTLIAEVWPGGQIVSDEALTQLVYRARNVIEPYGDLIVTIRGVGFALDADVREASISAPAPAAEEAATRAPGVAVQPDVDAADPISTAAGPGATAEPAVRVVPSAEVASRPARAGLLVATLAVLLMLLAGWLAVSRNSTPLPDIDDGYGFTIADLAPTHADTPNLFAQGLDQDARGDRERAISLMRTAHEADQGTPLPALMLALWAGGSVDQAGVKTWMDQANLRFDARTTPLLRLFRDYVAASADLDSQRVVATAGAVLGLRPDAWRMRHARAHLLEYRGMREAALHELQQIEFRALGHRKRDLIIADLASFGDPDAAERILAGLANDPEQATWHFLSARLAWSRQHWDDAIGKLRHSRELAHQLGRTDLQGRSLIYEAVALVVLGRKIEAAAAAEQARTLVAAGSHIDDLDMTMLLAGLRAERGQLDLVAEEVRRIRRLLAVTDRGDSRVSAWILLLRLSEVGADEGPVVEPGSAHEALWRAARQADGGEAALARESLALAVERGIASTRLWDDARHLQSRLGLPTGPEQPLDPPYAPLARVLLRQSLTANATGQTAANTSMISLSNAPSR